MKEKDLIHDFFTELTPRYEKVLDQELSTFWGWSYQSFVEQLITYTPFQPNQLILDFATGTSIIPRKIIQLNIPGLNIIGLDITEAMLMKGKQVIPADNFGQDIQLTCADAMMYPFKDNSFDVVISGLSSHHMNIEQMLSEVERVLKPNGVFSIIDVGLSPLWKFPGIKLIARVIALFYFSFSDNIKRGLAEAMALSNVQTMDDWKEDLHLAGFIKIEIHELQSKFKWFPKPFRVSAINPD